MSNNRPIEVQLWRGAIIPALTVAVLGNVIAYVVRGISGLIAGIFSLVIVVIFLGGTEIDCASHYMILYSGNIA